MSEYIRDQIVKEMTGDTPRVVHKDYFTIEKSVNDEVSGGIVSDPVREAISEHQKACEKLWNKKSYEILMERVKLLSKGENVCGANTETEKSRETE